MGDWGVGGGGSLKREELIKKNKVLDSVLLVCCSRN